MARVALELLSPLFDHWSFENSTKCCEISLDSDLIDDSAKDGGEEVFTKMHCVGITNL